MLSVEENLKTKQECKTKFPEVLANYAFPVGSPLRCDPPPTSNWPDRSQKHSFETKGFLHDFQMLAESSARTIGELNKRLNKLKSNEIIEREQKKIHLMEIQRTKCMLSQANSYFSAGILSDNLKQYAKSNEYYSKYHEIMLKIGYSENIAIAHNVIGVNHQLLGCIEQALICHEKHYKVADEEGKFCSKINSGLAYLRSNDIKKSSDAFADALKHAIRLNCFEAKSVAICFCGLISVAKGDYLTAKKQMEEYNTISKKIRDVNSQARSTLNLAHINKKLKNLKQCESNLKQSIRCASYLKDKKLENQAKLHLGLCRAEKVLDQLDEVKKTDEQNVSAESTKISPKDELEQ